MKSGLLESYFISDTLDLYPDLFHIKLGTYMHTYNFWN
jgi:hypothetical protein